MRKDGQVWCDTGNTIVELKLMTIDGSVQPMPSRPDVHQASSQDCLTNSVNIGRISVGE